MLDTLDFTDVSLWINGQYVHLPSLVQCLAMICFVGVSVTVYVMDALVRMSLRTHYWFVTECVDTVIAVFNDIPIIVYETTNVWIHRVVFGYHYWNFNFLLSFNCK